jgi:hypothetical protein
MSAARLPSSVISSIVACFIRQLYRFRAAVQGRDLLDRTVDFASLDIVQARAGTGADPAGPCSVLFGMGKAKGPADVVGSPLQVVWPPLT